MTNLGKPDDVYKLINNILMANDLSQSHDPKLRS